MRRVMIVDDNRQNRYLLEHLMRGHGWEVEEAPHGAEALAKAQRQPPDLVISDLLMPVMDGFTLLKHWKSDQQLQRIPFVVFTATYTDELNENFATQLGADAFIRKPIDPDAFVSQMERIVATIQEQATARTSLSAAEIGAEEYSRILFRKLESKLGELESTNLELRRREQQLRLALDAAHMGVWDWDVSGAQALRCVSGEELAAIVPRSVRGKRAEFGEPVLVQDRERLSTAIEHALSTGSESREEFQVQWADGSIHWFESRGRPCDERDGVANRWLSVVTDITERRQLEDQLRRAHQLETIGQLASAVAHDFNNLLSVIAGNAELAQRTLGESHPALEQLREVLVASSRGKAVIQQILAAGRVQPLERKPTALQGLVEESAQLLRAVLPTSVELRLTFGSDVPDVLVDSTRVQQALLNLCTNAWHALPNDSGRIEVLVDAVTVAAGESGADPRLRAGRYARLAVHDNGSGIDERTRQRMLEPFFTTKAPGRGTGLGLAIVDDVVASHAGVLIVHSELGRGSSFELYFPAAEQRVPEPIAEHPAAAPTRKGNEHVLYLDDEAALVRLMVRALSDEGYRVSGFTRASEALAAFRNNPHDFDLLVTDLHVADANGLQVAAELIKLRPELPVILLSGNVTRELAERARRSGIEHIAAKPVMVREMLLTIEHALSTPRSKRPA